MSKFILAITGPTASGKSTVAKHLSQKIDRCVNIEIDHIKHIIVNPFKYDRTEEGFEQWRLLGSNVGLLASKYHTAEYNVIINGYLDVTGWQALLMHVDLSHRVRLTLDIAENEKRDTNRAKEAVMGGGWVKKHHKYFSDEEFYSSFASIDSSNHEVKDTAKEIAKHIGKNWGEL